jgi:hypothetical protein
LEPPNDTVFVFGISSSCRAAQHRHLLFRRSRTIEKCLAIDTTAVDALSSF